MTVAQRRSVRRRATCAAAVWAAVLALSGCQTTDLAGLPGFRKPPTAQLEALVGDGLYDEADRFYGDHAGALGADPDAAATLKRLAGALTEKHIAAVQRAAIALGTVTWPVPSEQWGDVAAPLTAARNAVRTFDAFHVMNRPGQMPAAAAALKADLAAREETIRAGAVADLLAYRAADGQTFFSAYPLPLDPPRFLSANAESIVRRLDGDGGAIQALVTAAPQVRAVPALTKALGRAFAAAMARESENRGDVVRAFAWMSARARAAALGLDPGTAQARGADEIAFVEATSQTLLRQGQIDFPAGVDVDLPVRFAKAALEDVLSKSPTEAPRFVVVFDVALAKASRRVLNLKEIPSTIFVGYGDAGSRGVAAGNTSAGPRSLALFGPRGTGEPLFQAYAYTKATVQARKTLTAHYYVIDRRARTVFKSAFDVSEEERFDVGYNIHAADPRKNLLANELASEKDIDDFEKAPVTVKLSQLVGHYLRAPDGERPFTSALALRKELLADKNAVLAKAEANRFDARPLNDPRFDSVVVVYKGGRGMGSGFFVAPDVVLTNWHVVDGAKFVEMKTYDGQETFGKVLAKDARIDAALVEVQSRGRPVAFKTGRSLDPGTTVEAIGHPQGHQFSITRGIVSAVRKEYSINLPRGAGDKVLYIQTDAPINPGNSGGPLFDGNAVAGMNTWGYVASDGLAFSVHYSELLAFLNEHLPGFNVPADGSKP